MTKLDDCNFTKIDNYKFSHEIKISFFIAIFGILVKIFFSYIGLIEYSFDSLVLSIWQLGTMSSIFSFASVMLLSTHRQNAAKLIWLLSGVVCFIYVYFMVKDNDAVKKITIILLTLGIVSFFLLMYTGFYDLNHTIRTQAKEKLFLVLIIAIVSVYGVGIVSISSSLSPRVYDAILYKFDASLGFSASVILSKYIADNPNLLNFIIYPVYLALPLGMGLQYVQQMQSKEPPKTYLLLFWFSSIFIVCLLAYLLLPAMGPKYLFGNYFPHNMPPLDNIISIPVVNQATFPRNAFPSMHFGWAFTMWLNAILMKGKWQARFFFIIGILTIIATLGLGEHYLIDLIVAVPFSYALQGIFLRGLPIENVHRWKCILIGLSLWLFWVVTLRLSLDIYTKNNYLSWISVIFTIAVSSLYYRRMIKAQDEHFSSVSNMPIAKANLQENNNLKPIFYLFILSGFSGLIYEVVFSKELALIFGSSSIATYTVLATYMGGMALGAGLGGWIKTHRPLLGYISCELFIGVYCIITPLLFKLIQSLYVSLASGVSPDAGVLTFYRLALGAILLLPPTIVMGATMPLLLAHCREKQGQLHLAVANLYAANTIGAAFGALLAGYFIIPKFGISLSTAFAAAINFFVAFIGIQLFKRHEKRAHYLNTKDVYIDTQLPVNRLKGVQALTVLFFGGVITLALEVKYMFLLAVVAGNSSYAFSLMLFTFLLGLAAGSILIKPWLKSPNILALLEFSLAAVILLGVFSWQSIPAYFASFANYPSAQAFGAREFIRGLVCFCAMFPPALLIGAIYPVAMNCVATAFPNHPIVALGLANSLNTSGNIVGVLLTSFVLIPALGVLLSIKILACLAFTLAIMLSVSFIKNSNKLNIIFALIVVVVFYIQPKSFNYTELASGANVYFSALNWGESIDHAESIDGGLTTVVLNKNQQVKTLLTNGKFQGNNALKGEMQAQTGFALAPLLHTDARERALVIGYGTGATSRVLNETGFKNLDIVDLSSDIVRLANQHFPAINQHVTEKKGVATYITDGRNYLLLTDKSYDLIGLEITSIWFAGAASLYNQEFYALAKRKLKSDGVLQQWVQLHHTQLNDLLSVLASVRSEFKYVWLYEIGGQGIIVATNNHDRSPKKSYADLISQTSGLKEVLKIYDRPVNELAQKILLEPEGLDRFLLKVSSGDPEAWVSTDDNLYLEYETPKGNVLDGAQSLANNLEMIKKFSAK
ncbi:fused MFS/spermidine synthase [Iodobacter sp. LRB]|uniref:fused MFS/spermidine synthase n=1 Tax=unclassified Iodobacter TaxID=235634 RepID=UPI000C0CCF4C|nr:fused MFS/spermidine synthase [Iodobacter sp. BJB302]PHV03078.1 hypothetical protein CSQ88_03905 [Iodobacter sp. BJB302]